MFKAKVTKLAVSILAIAVSAVNLSAQEGRKVISNPIPAYPQLARNNHITGGVKVQVVIAPDGHIKSTEVIGGHPLLSDCRCGTNLFATSPLNTNKMLLTVTCLNCGHPRQQLAGLPLTLFRVGPGGVLFTAQVYGKKPPSRAAALASRRYDRDAKAAASG